MRVIVAGTRTIQSYKLVKQAIIDSGFDMTELVSGKEPNGVDSLGEVYAKYRGIPIKDFPYIRELGRAGGPVRNEQMAEYASQCPEGGALVLVWDGKSRGSTSMKKLAIKYGLNIFEVIV